MTDPGLVAKNKMLYRSNKERGSVFHSSSPKIRVEEIGTLVEKALPTSSEMRPVPKIHSKGLAF